ncbi:MAG: MFS transporter [Chloroflexi bacterium]|nr:MFS transporter [Chloroflexota bacterium]
MSDPVTPRGGPPRRTPPGSLAVFGSRDFRLFWVGFAVSNTGRWVEMTGALWIVSTLSDSPLVLGGLGIARALPAILLSPIAGVIADRFDQRRLVMITQATSLLLSLALAASILLGTVAIWQVYLQLAIQSCVQPFDLAARQALFPRLVPRRHLPDAVTLTVAAARTAKFLGPVIGGLLIASVGLAAPYLLNAVSFVVLIAAAWEVRPAAITRPEARPSFIGELRAGFDEIRRAPLVRGVFQLEAVFGLFQVNDVMITIVARTVLGLGPEGLGLLLATPALGALVGIAGLVLTRPIRRQGRVAVGAVLIYAAVMLVVAGSPLVVITCLALAATGLLDSLVTVVRHSVLQLAAPGDKRGRIMANMAVVSNGVAPLSQVQTGLLTSLLGPPLGIATAACALALTSGVVAFRNRTLWVFETTRPSGDPTTEPMPPERS